MYTAAEYCYPKETITSVLGATINTSIVGVGEYGISSRERPFLKTYALGSCVGVVFISPDKNAAGLVHVALPDSSLNPQLARIKPGMFADTGIPAILRRMAVMGCNPRYMTIKLIGGARILNDDKNFNIGSKNIVSIKRILWEMGMMVTGEDVGNNYSRTVSVDPFHKRVTISSPGRGEWLV